MGNRVDITVKKLFLYYIVSGLIFALSLSAIIISKKYSNSLSNALYELQRCKINLFKMRDAINDMEIIASTMGELIPNDSSAKKPEIQISMKLDELKSRITEAEITVANMEYKEDEISLPVNIKAPMKDYTAFVNNISYLQSLKFPVFSLNSISIAQLQSKEALSPLYEINGAFRLPNRQVGNSSPEEKDLTR